VCYLQWIYWPLKPQYVRIINLSSRNKFLHSKFSVIKQPIDHRFTWLFVSLLFFNSLWRLQSFLNQVILLSVRLSFKSSVPPFSTTIQFFAQQTFYIYFVSNNQLDALIIQIYSVIKLYTFWTSSVPIIRSYLLYMRHW